MNKLRNHITVFEHETIRFDKGEKRISEEQFKTLQNYYGDGIPYYNLCYNGIHFNEYVGVIQIDNTLIEVLPKADKIIHSGIEETKWRNILIGMLKAVGSFEIKSTSESKLKIKPNTILDLYFEMFIKEVEYLYHNGLVKKYRNKDNNVTTLKGRLQFGKNIQQNLTHQERFYVRYTTYDVEHKLHFILYKTIRLLKQINTNVSLHSRIGALLLNFPEMPEIKITKATFEKLVLNKKTQSYKKAIEISKLLLLQYHPDVCKGRNNLLALMFDMNKLWEKFVFMSLRRNKNITVTAKTSENFWKPQSGKRSKIIPDIVVNRDKENCVVLDTKWKNLNGNNPSSEDLRQMYVYHEYYGAKRVALVYPGNPKYESKGTFYPSKFYDKRDKECSVILFEVPEKIQLHKSIVKTWQEQIGDKLSDWMQSYINN